MIIEFPAPTKLLTLNQRLHHMARYRIEQAWQEQAFYFAAQAAQRLRIRGLGPSIVKVTLPVKSLSTRRDPHNFTATLKPIIDGIVRTKRFWPDDNSDWVTTFEPEFWTGSNVLVEIYPRQA